MWSAESRASAPWEVDHTAKRTPSDSRSMRPSVSRVSIVGMTISRTVSSVRNPSAPSTISKRTLAITSGPRARATKPAALNSASSDGGRAKRAKKATSAASPLTRCSLTPPTKWPMISRTRSRAGRRRSFARSVTRTW
jgi:hypothetical protein